MNFVAFFLSVFQFAPAHVIHETCHLVMFYFIKKISWKCVGHFVPIVFGEITSCEVLCKNHQTRFLEKLFQVSNQMNSQISVIMLTIRTLALNWIGKKHLKESFGLLHGLNCVSCWNFNNALSSSGSLFTVYKSICLVLRTITHVLSVPQEHLTSVVTDIG